MQNLPIPTEENYYSQEMAKIYCGASQFLDIVGRPFLPGCEARAMATINGTWEPDVTKALLIGSITDALFEGATSEELVARFPDCVSTRGATKGQIKAEFQQAIKLYERCLRDKKFMQLMSGQKQLIAVGEIEALPFKVKLDSYIEGRAIVDLKTTQDTSRDKRYFVADSGEKLPFYIYMSYEVQLAIYREIMRQNTGETLRCYIAAVDKKPHPRPETIEIEPKILDDALEYVKRHCNHIIRLKSGEIEPIRCESGDCDYCRDTYECKIISTSEFETHDIGKNDI